MKSFFRKSIAAVLTLGILFGTFGGSVVYADAENNEGSSLGASTSCARHTLGTFSGVPACVNANGDLHICAKNFPDEGFRNYIENLKGAENGYFTPEERNSVRSIEIPSSRGVRSLRGIEFFIRLNYLFCCGNQLTELDTSRNTELRTLYCYENQLTKLDVSGNTVLKDLYCHGNQLTELDASGNTALKTLDCQLNQLTKLDVSGNTVLEDLYCCNNQLTDLDVSGDTALKTLYCNNNQLTDLNVSSNTALTSLHCDDNHLTRLDVRDNINLHILDCSNNNITELFINEQDDNWWWNLVVSPQTSTLPLVQNGAVWTADLRSLVEDTSRVETDTISEGIYDWDTGLIIFTKKPAFFECYIGKGRQEMLVTVYLIDSEPETPTPNPGLGASTSCARHTLGTFSGVPACVNANGDLHICAKNFPDEGFRNHIENLKGAENGYFTPEERNSVRSIEIPSSRGVRSLRGIEFFTRLNYLFCCGNQLTELDTSRNTELRTLYCYENQLTKLDVSGNTVLKDLFCWGNQLTELDVSGNTALETLDCQLNQLTKLDVSGNTVLEDLYCCNNQLTELDVSGDTALEGLNCNNNQLTELDVSGNTALRVLDCHNNHLTRLDVRDNINLHNLNCSNNNMTELFINEQDDNWWWNLVVSPQTSTLPLVQNGAVWTADLRSLVEDTSRVETDTISEGIYDWDTGLIIFTKKPAFFECYIGKGRQEMLVIVYLTESEATYKATINGTEHAYAAGEQVTLTADAFYLDGNWGYRFDTWTGDVGAVADVKSSTTTFTMPAQNVIITPKHYLIGDVDGNGVVDSLDAANIIRMASGTMTPTLTGDITGTGVVDAMSVANIARYIAGTFTPAK